jgi:hypothetical protein
MIRKVLLVCGILSSLLYIIANILGAMRWEGYSYTSQTVSELSAIGAPSRPVVVALMLAYSILVIAFGVGVWKTASRNRALRVVAYLLVGYGVVCLMGPFTKKVLNAPPLAVGMDEPSRVRVRCPRTR